jgi:dTDP-4-dehydrorhamnose reductase
MTRVAITASTGMLGSMLYRVLRERFELVLLYRDEHKLRALDEAYGGVSRHRTVQLDLAEVYRAYLEGGQRASAGVLDGIGEVDAVVNSAGVIIPRMLDAPEMTLFVNGVLPHLLSAHYGARLVHVTTDCVYSGRAGAPYDENAPASPNDLYGLSKSMGEPAAGSLVLRTSIIGPEIVGSSSLLEWLRNRRGETVDGYVNHYWNGVTTLQLATGIAQILDARTSHPETGLFHVFGTDVSKYDLLRMLDERYCLGVTVQPKQVHRVDRRLATVRGLNEVLRIPPLPAMIDQLP